MKVFSHKKTKEDLDEVEKIIQQNDGRFVLYDFLIGRLALIDKERMVILFIDSNLYGQIYSINEDGVWDEDCICNINGRTISGFIKRSNGNNYFNTGKVIDTYLYYHLMSDDQKSKLRSTPNMAKWDFITCGDDLSLVLKAAYEYSINYKDMEESLSKAKVDDWRKNYIEIINDFVKNYNQL